MALADAFIQDALKQNSTREDTASLWGQASQLAQMKMQHQQQLQQLQQKQQELQTAKIEKLYGFIADAKNYENAGDRNNYLKNAIGMRNALGLKPDVLSDDQIRAFGSDENMGRIATLQSAIQSGDMSLQEAAALAANPQKFGQVMPTPANAVQINKVDWTSAQEKFLGQQTELRKAQMQINAGKEKKEGTDYNQTVQLLETMRGNPAVQQAEKDVYAIDKAKALSKVFPPDKMSSQMANLLYTEVAKVASGSSPTVHELEGFNPNTLTGKAAKKYSEFMNEPTPANAGAFIRDYMSYADRLSADAQKTITDRYGRIINAKSQAGQISSKEQRVLQDNYINRFDNTPGGQSKPINVGGHDLSIDQLKAFLASPQAKANPNDATVVAAKKALAGGQ